MLVRTTLRFWIIFNKRIQPFRQRPKPLPNVRLRRFMKHPDQA